MVLLQPKKERGLIMKKTNSINVLGFLFVDGAILMLITEFGKRYFRMLLSFTE